MNLEALARFARAHDDYDICVIAHAGSRYYQVALEPADGSTHVLTRRDKPMMFRSLDDVYGELKQADIQSAYLVEQAADDESAGRKAHYRVPLRPRMPLVF